VPTPIDFDSSDGLKVIRAAIDAAEEHQDERNAACERWYQSFHSYLDMTGRNPALSNITIPKIWSVIRTNVPKIVRAAIGRRPYIEFDANREEFKDLSRLQVNMLDQLCYLGGFGHQYTTDLMLNAVNGTAFMECLPYYQNDIQEILQPRFRMDYSGLPVADGFERTAVEIRRLRYKITPFAPYEILVDPMATGLETEDGCRYIVKVQLVSKRQLKKLADQGAYPGLDVGKLNRAGDDYGGAPEKHRGYSILQAMGYTTPDPDSDVGLLYRYESPERYIDMWNDRVILRDQANPYAKTPELMGHGLINLSRMVHNIDPHTQMRFWGDGDVAILEKLNALLNDLFNMALNNHMFSGQGKTYYAEGRGVQGADLVHELAHKVGFQLRDGEKIQDLVVDDYGQPLPVDHYALIEKVEAYMDLTVNQYEINRGESATGDQTLGELSMLREAGDTRLELNVKTQEDLFLNDWGHKCLCHNRQWLTDDDVEELLGPEDAEVFAVAHPGDMPGGYNFTMNGSDRVVNQNIKQQSLAVLNDLMIQSPYTKIREWQKIRMQAHDLGDQEELVLVSEEEMAARQQQMQMAAGAGMLDSQGSMASGMPPEQPAPIEQPMGVM